MQYRQSCENASAAAAAAAAAQSCEAPRTLRSSLLQQANSASSQSEGGRKRRDELHLAPKTYIVHVVLWDALLVGCPVGETTRWSRIRRLFLPTDTHVHFLLLPRQLGDHTVGPST
jgi:hypothetical protein